MSAPSTFLLLHSVSTTKLDSLLGMELPKNIVFTAQSCSYTCQLSWILDTSPIILPNLLDFRLKSPTEHPPHLMIRAILRHLVHVVKEQYGIYYYLVRNELTLMIGFEMYNISTHEVLFFISKLTGCQKSCSRTGRCLRRLLIARLVMFFKHDQPVLAVRLVVSCNCSVHQLFSSRYIIKYVSTNRKCS